MKRILIIGMMTILLICLAIGTAGAETYQTVEEAVTGIIAEMHIAGITGEYNQAVWLHDWLTGHADYDEGNQWFSPEGVLLHGTGVCQSYTDAYALLLDAAGIQNATITSNSMKHTWNVVNLEGAWCYVDVTWDDPTGGGGESHFYFGMNEALLTRDHTLEDHTYTCATLGNYYPLRYDEGILLVSNKEEMIQKLNAVIPNFPNVISLNYYGTDPTFSVVGTFVEWAETVNYRYGILGYTADYQNFLASFEMEYTDPWEKSTTVLDEPVTADSFSMESPTGIYRLSNYNGNGVVLVFGRRTCANTRAFLKGFRSEIEGLASVGVETLVSVIEANDDEDILAMEETLAEAGVSPGYHFAYDQIGLMWNYLSAVGVDIYNTGVTFPCIFLINASGQIVSYSTGFVRNMPDIIASAYALGTGKSLPEPEQIDPHDIENGSGNINQLSGNSQVSAIKSAVANGKYVMFLSNKALNYNNTQSFLESWEKKHNQYEELGIELIVALEEMPEDDIRSAYPHVQFVDYNEDDFWPLLRDSGFSGESASYLCNFFYAPDGHCIAYSNGSTLSLNTCALYVNEARDCSLNGHHTWGDPVYVWSDDNSTVTATRTCIFDSSHFETETVNTHAGDEIPATCEDPCLIVYTSDSFENEAFIQQEKQITTSEPLGHEWDEPVYTWSEDHSTVTATHICLRDNTHEESETVAALEEIMVEPTCEFSGTAKYTSAAFENTAFEVQIEVLSDIEALGHDWDEPVYTWADENNAVTATRICKRDNSHVETETISATAEVIKLPTCESKGRTKYTSANFENEAFIVQTKTLTDIDALGHDWDDIIYVWSNDKREVTASRKCRNDYNHIETETVDTSSKVVLPATCETKGKTKYTSAEFENEEFDVQEKTVTDIPALGHEWNDSVYDWTDDNRFVTATRICNHDASHVETETVTVTSAIDKAATCETKGKTKYTSAVFENPAFSVQSKTLTDINALGHDWGTPIYSWADDNSTVTAIRICVNDDKHTETETVNVGSTVEKPATCENKGKTKYTGAAFDNTAFTAQIKTLEDIEPLGHDWGIASYAWADDNRTITATRTCSHDDSHVETETATVTSEIKLQPSCESMGKTKYTSAAFENEAFAIQTKTLTDIDALGHDWERIVYVWADDKSTVTATRTCKNDTFHDHIETETVSVTATVTNPATCEFKGTTKYQSAEFENEEFTVQVRSITDIPALGHDWGAPEYSWADDNSTVTATRVCENDNSHVETEDATVTVVITAPATCEVKGQTTYTGSAYENEAFTAQTRTLTDIDALGHIPVTDDAVEATCTKTGLTEGSHCSVCKKILKAQEVLPLVDHQYAIFDAVPATCEETGLTSHVECTECGNILIASTTIPALGHEWGEPTYIWSKDNTEITATARCTRDEHHTIIEDVDAYRIAITSPTETDPGSYIWRSNLFDNSLFAIQETEGGSIPALGKMNVMYLPSFLTTIETESFDNVAVEAIILPNTLTTIEPKAFTNCKNLKYIKVPAGLTIPDDTFEGSPMVVIDQK